MGVLDAVPLPSVSSEGLRSTLALRPFFARLAARGTSPVNLFFLGDSRTEGQATTALADRWQDQLLANLRSRYPVAGVTGGRGYVPAWYAFNSPSPTGNGFTTSGSVTQSTTYGLGRRSLTLGTGATATGTFTCSALDLYMAAGASASSVTYSIDGGSAVTVNVGSGNLGGQVTRITPGSAGSHTIVVTQVSGSPIFEGVMVYNGDETKGIRSWDGAHFGYTSNNFSSNLSWSQSLVPAASKADLVVVALGTNDHGLGVTSAVFKTQMQAIVTNLRLRAATAPIVLIGDIERGDAPVGAIEPWANYTAALQSLAASNSGCVYFDFTRRAVRADLDTTLFNADKVHENTIGHTFKADILTGFLTPR